MLRTSLSQRRGPYTQLSVRAHASNSLRRSRQPLQKNNKRNPQAQPKSTTSSPKSRFLQPFAWYRCVCYNGATRLHCRLVCNARTNLVVFRLLPSAKLETHPLLTKGITSGIIAGFGDVLGQSIQSQDSLWEMMRTGRFDIIRTGRFVLLGTFLVGPVCHVWYGSLMQRFPGSSFQRITTRVVLDQFCFAPLFLPTWLLNLWMLQGKSADYVAEEMPRILPEMVINNWKLWIPAQSINLGFVASKYQVLVSNVVAVAWNTYLSITTQPSNTSDAISFLKEEAVEC